MTTFTTNIKKSSKKRKHTQLTFAQSNTVGKIKIPFADIQPRNECHSTHDEREILRTHTLHLMAYIINAGYIVFSAEFTSSIPSKPLQSFILIY